MSIPNEPFSLQSAAAPAAAKRRQTTATPTMTAAAELRGALAGHLSLFQQHAPSTRCWKCSWQMAEVAGSSLRVRYRAACHCQHSCFGMNATLVRHSWGFVGAILMHGGAQKRVSPATCWQISTEIPLGATCAALADSLSTHVLHAERAGWLRDALGETGRLV